MDTDLDTLATALYVTTDDLLKAHPDQLPDRPVVDRVVRGRRAFAGAAWWRCTWRAATHAFPGVSLAVSPGRCGSANPDSASWPSSRPAPTLGLGGVRVEGFEYSFTTRLHRVRRQSTRIPAP